MVILLLVQKIMEVNLKTITSLTTMRKMASTITSQHLEPFNKMVLLEGRIDV